MFYVPRLTYLITWWRHSRRQSTSCISMSISLTTESKRCLQLKWKSLVFTQWTCHTIILPNYRTVSINCSAWHGLISRITNSTRFKSSDLSSFHFFLAVAVLVSTVYLYSTFRSSTAASSKVSNWYQVKTLLGLLPNTFVAWPRRRFTTVFETSPRTCVSNIQFSLTLTATNTRIIMHKSSNTKIFSSLVKCDNIEDIYWTRNHEVHSLVRFVVQRTYSSTGRSFLPRLRLDRILRQ